MSEKEVSIWEKIDEDLTISRRLEREESCGMDYWIIGQPDGERILKPYHCGSCDDCKHRKALNLQTRVMALAYVGENNLRIIKLPPKAMDTVVDRINTSDYARYPSANGFDYLISIGGAGKSVLDADIDWDSLIDRRPNTRKSGKLLTYTKEKPDQVIPVKDIRASSYDDALHAVQLAIEYFSEEDYDKIIDNETELVMKNNMVSAHIMKTLADKGNLVFDHAVEREYSLPIKFKLILTIEESKESTNG